MTPEELKAEQEAFRKDSTAMLDKIKREMPSLKEDEARAVLTMAYFTASRQFAKQVAALERDVEALTLAAQANELLIDALRQKEPTPMENLKVFSCTAFHGHFPVGTAAVVIAPTVINARDILHVALVLEGLRQERPLELDAFKELDLSKPGAYILNDGNY